MRLLRSIVALLGTGLIVAVLLGYGGPLLYGLDVLAHFRLHLLVLSCIVAPAALALRARAALWRLLAAAVLAAAGLGPLWEAPPGGGRGPAGGGVAVTVMTANTFFHNRRPAQMRAALAAAGADLLLTVETSREAMAGHPSLAAIYPYRVMHATGSPDLRAVLWSKFPVLEGETVLLHAANGVPHGVRAVVEIAPGRTLSVLGLHLAHPWAGDQGRQVERLAELSAGLPRPLVVMGDFNATSWSWAVLRAGRLTGTRRIGGIAWTWRGEWPVPLVTLGEPLGLPIDHVLVSEGIGVERIGTVTIPGSDHRAVRAVLRIAD